MKILGIESSCDETAAAVIEFNHKGVFNILSNSIYSQTEEHAVYGGVVPEIASRAHMERIESITEQAIEKAGINLEDLDAIAVTSGPGLLGGLVIGTTFAKSVSMAKNIDILGINHLEGHALVAQLTEDLEFPYTLMLASGGHCQFIHVQNTYSSDNKTSNVNDQLPLKLAYTELGGTLDDAIGECFDKVAKMLGLGYPGGPKIEKHALNGDAQKYTFPQPLKNGTLSFSFSGLKSAVRRQIDALGELSEQDVNDLCASFQYTVSKILTYKCKLAIEQTEKYGTKKFVLAGGVAANKILRKSLEELCEKKGISFYAPPINLCTDNAVMIAYAGAMKILQGHKELPIDLKPRWPLSKI